MGRTDEIVAAQRFGDSWIDITRPLSRSTPVWPGDVPFTLDQSVDEGMILSSFQTTCHVGTHVDAPRHLDAAASGVDSIPLSRLVGVADVVAATGTGPIVSIDDLPHGWVPAAKRVLIRTDSQPLGAAIEGGFRALGTEAVYWLADRGVELVGVDVPSVDSFDADELTSHRALMQCGMTWIEGLWLGTVEPARYFLVALPMLLVGAEAAPVRALLHPIPQRVTTPFLD